MLIIFIESGLARNKPPFIDPKITSGERSTYEVKENGKVSQMVHIISREQRNGKDVYIVCAESYQMILATSDLRPISIKKTKANGELEFSIEYTAFNITEQSLKNLKSEGISGDVLERLESIKNQKFIKEEKFVDILKTTIGEEQTVKFKSLILKHAEYNDDRVKIYNIGAPRNKVIDKAPEDRYDLNTILEFVRGFPFGKDKVEFTLVTREPILRSHKLGAYIKIVGNERITVPAGTFDCCRLESGFSGLRGKVIRTKFFFWVEKTPPHRLIKHTDSSGERLVTLVGSEILKN